MDIPPELVPVINALGFAATPATILFLTKLAKTVAPAVGKIYQPIEKLIDAKTQNKVDFIREKGAIDNRFRLEEYEARKLSERESRAAERIRYTQDREQANIEASVRMAAEDPPVEVSEEPVNEDWFFRWVDGAKTVSDEEAQKLWGKILNGEIAQPGTFSFRTLDILRNLTSHEAKIFVHFAKYFVNVSPGIVEQSLILEGKIAEYLSKTHWTFYENFYLLKEVGLIQSANKYRTYKYQEHHKWISVEQGTLVLDMELIENKSVFLTLDTLSTSGEQLFSLLQVENDPEYMEVIKDFFIDKTKVSKIRDKRNREKEILQQCLKYSHDNNREYIVVVAGTNSTPRNAAEGHGFDVDEIAKYNNLNADDPSEDGKIKIPNHLVEKRISELPTF